ncbi:hypothetical protein FRB98_000936 [Tulasnella sp. 332]|nr:hypothetical protein FRB98_000936 [Tulasnella sp. 332]
MVKSVRDAAVGLSVLAGIDALDEMTLDNPIGSQSFDYTQGLEEFSLEGVRIGLLPESIWNRTNIAEKGGHSRLELIKTLNNAGADVVDGLPYNHSA